MEIEPDDLGLDEEKPRDTMEPSRGQGKSLLWYAIALISVAFLVAGIVLANPFIDYQTASTL